MKAAVVPAVSSSWQIKDVPQPQTGPGQVLEKMRASGICYTDVHETLGHIPGPFPRILGSRAGGRDRRRVSRCGHAKGRRSRGHGMDSIDVWTLRMVPAGRRMFCPYLRGTGLDVQGGHAEYMLMNADATYLIPDKVSLAGATVD